MIRPIELVTAWMHHNFAIGFTNIDPLQSAPVYNQYESTCLPPQPQGLPLNSTLTFSCQPYNVAGRWLILQLPGTGISINICEIEAYCALPAR